MVNLLVLSAIFAGCTHKPKTLKINLEYENENIQFKQEFFSKETVLGSDTIMMGIPRWKECRQRYKFRFILDDLSSLYYVYLSIESFEVEETHHPIYLNNKKLGHLKKSTHRYEGGPTYPLGTPIKFHATQFYLPKEYLKTGKNVLEVNHAWPKSDGDKFALGRIDVVAVYINDELSKKEVKDRKREERYFPKDLEFLHNLTDEEIYIVAVNLPQVITELNMAHGLHRKKLSYIYSKIGDYYRWKGDYIKNLHYQQKALDTELEEGNTTLIPYLRAHLGLSQYYIGNYQLSIATCKEALIDIEKVEIRQLKKLSRNKYENILGLNSLINAYIALNYFQLKNYTLAEQYCVTEWPIWSFNQDQPIAIAINYQILGNMDTIKKDFKSAASHYEMAIRALNQYPKIYYDSIQNTKLYLANAYYRQGDYNKALDEISSVENQTNEFKWKSRLLLGDILHAENDIDNAIKQYIQSIDEIEFSRSKLNLHGFKISFMNDKLEPYRKAISSLAKVDRTDEAFNYAEKAKARAFLDLIATAKDFTFSISGRLKELSTEESQLRRKLIDLQARYDTEQKLFSERGTNRETQLKLEEARGALNKFYTEKASQDDQFASLSTVSTMSIQEVLKIIPDGISVVEYYYDSNHIYIWVLDNSQRKFLKKDIQSLHLQNLIKKYRDLIHEGKDLRGLKSAEKIEVSAFSGRSQFQKVESLLKSILLDGVFDQIKSDKVYIVPHGLLHYFPFQSLIYHSKYLIENYQIGYIPSATALKYVFAKRKQKSGNLLAFGNPDLNATQMQLPFAEKEVQGIKTLFPTANIKIGEDASEANFKEHAGGYDILHIASHGEFNANTPLFSCLRLSAGNGEDGRLETREIFGLNLNAYLVTLSACNTAIGKLTKGDEVVGLTRAFIFAGTPSILGTIWSVNDESTSIFMNHFYNNLKTMDKLKSLQKAQIALINNKKYSNPYHWAGFQLIGDYY
jgi:CHAT domain-containing protein